jgi:hypothetical protein
MERNGKTGDNGDEEALAAEEPKKTDEFLGHSLFPYNRLNKHRN